MGHLFLLSACGIKYGALIRYKRQVLVSRLVVVLLHFFLARAFVLIAFFLHKASQFQPWMKQQRCVDSESSLDIPIIQNLPLLWKKTGVPICVVRHYGEEEPRR